MHGCQETALALLQVEIGCGYEIEFLSHRYRYDTWPFWAGSLPEDQPCMACLSSLSIRSPRSLIWLGVKGSELIFCFRGFPRSIVPPSGSSVPQSNSFEMNSSGV